MYPHNTQNVLYNTQNVPHNTQNVLQLYMTFIGKRFVYSLAATKTTSITQGDQITYRC